MTAEQWRAKAHSEALEEAQTLQLPSGMEIKARRPGPALLASYGRLPMGLATAAIGAGGQDADTRTEALVEMATFYRDLLTYCVVEPVISLKPKAGEIHPREIPNADFNFILIWAARGEEAKSLETFRRQPANGSAGDGGAQVPAAPQPAAESGGPGAGV